MKNKIFLVSLFIILSFQLRLTGNEAQKIEENKSKPNVEELKRIVERQEVIEYQEQKIEVATEEVQEKSEQVAQSNTYSRGGHVEVKYSKILEVTATAYSPDCDPYWNKPAGGAKGLKAVIGRVIAVDPKVIPLGSLVYIEFSKDTHLNGYYQAVDTGGAIKQNKIDVLLQNDKVSRNFGRQKATVKIINKK